MEEIIILSVGAECDGMRLDRFLSGTREFSRSYVQKLIQSGLVCVNGDIAMKAKVPVFFGDTVEMKVPRPEPLAVSPEKMELDILYEDEHLLVVNKPKGMVVHPAAGHREHTLVNGLLYHCRGKLSGINGVMRPGIVHRIDRDTTGALVVCKTDAAHRSLADQLSVHSITRKYRAVVYDNLPCDTGTVDAPIGRHPVQRKKMAVVDERTGRRAVTHYRVLDRLNHNFNSIECELETGRTHQIRVHMAHIRHPVLGDAVYGPEPPRQFAHLEGQTLHAEILGFTHPATGVYMEFRAPLPDYFEAVIRRLGG